MAHSAKYIIHADVRTSGVVERSDVVGAIYGQTEGLLGDELDLRALQDSSKVGRIDVDIESEGGRSFGTVRIATGLNRTETAVLAAALETIERVGPSRAECTVREIEDARAAKRREIVDRATELLAEFEQQTLTSEQLVEEVQQRARAEEITEYHGLPAGPRVTDSDAIIVVEGRADVKTLLSHGIKNAVAVEGTDIPDPVARLSTERTTTAFLDGDRGGDLILQELTQMGDVDYVAFAPSGQSVEDLDRTALLTALRKKLPYEQVAEANTAREAFAPTDGGTVTMDPTEEQSKPDAAGHPDEGVGAATPNPDRARTSEHAGADPVGEQTDAEEAGEPAESSEATDADEATDSGEPDAETTTPEETDATANAETDAPTTIQDHIAEVIQSGGGTVRLLDDSLAVLAEADAEAALEAIEDAETVPHTVVLDGTVTQRLLDVAAQRGVGQLVGADTGEFVKQPATVRVHTAEALCSE